MGTGRIATRGNFFLLFVASAFLLNGISPALGIKCMMCGDGTVPCDEADNAPKSGDCAEGMKGCKRTMADGKTMLACDAEAKDDCSNMDMCMCMTDDCNMKDKCMCAGGEAGAMTTAKSGGGDDMASGQAINVPLNGAAMVVLSLGVSAILNVGVARWSSSRKSDCL